MNIHNCIKATHRFTASCSAKTLHSISFIINAYYNGGGCITCGASSEKAITTSIQDELFDQFNDESHASWSLGMSKDE